MKFFTFLILMVCVSCTWQENSNVTIIPQPESIIKTGGFFRMKNDVSIYFSDTLSSSLYSVFAEQMKDYILLKKVNEEKSDIEISIETGKPSEAYKLQVRKNKIVVYSATLNGAFNGLQSLRQLIMFSKKKNGKILIPLCQIIDTPRYEWRGIMLDESRHFFGAEKVKQLLDIMSLHKLNIFHWHLTDVPGWRLEIKKYPLLTLTGAIGNQTDKNAHAMYYTQDHVREIVKYAKDRFIQIIPEIDMPGHAGASNRAYPEFSGGGSEAYPEFTFNPGIDETYSYLTDILREVTGMFPAQYIHLGGDEVNFGNQHWNEIPQIKSLMKKNKLPDLKAVEQYFVRKMSDSINSLHKITIGWDEITDFKLDPERVVIMWWRHDKPQQLEAALQRKYKVILCPRIPLYFDFVQDNSHKIGRRWKGAFSDLETVYNFPQDTIPGLKNYGNQVLGIQANIWTEVIGDNMRLDFMTYPRLTALAESAWTRTESKNYKSFLERLKPLLEYFKKENLYYYDPFTPDKTPEPAASVKN